MTHRPHGKRILTLAFLLILLSVPSGARADVAPPAQPPGSSVQPGVDTTQVRMLAETVTLDVQPGSTDKSLGQAQVTADFTMHNTGTADESMAARFPIGATDGFFSVNEIRNLRIQVAGQPVATRRIMGEDPYNGSAQVPWAEFDVRFPAAQDTSIRVSYTLEATGEYPFIWFKYILSSGAGWKDAIGSADILVRFPYELNTQNLLLDTAQVWFGTSPGGILEDRQIRWHYDNLEPTNNDNFEVNLVMPSAWERLLAEQDNVTRNPRDGESWGRLGRLCKQMAYSSRGKGFRSGNVLDPGAAELYTCALQAYEKAVTLLPADALWHAGYADLLAYHAYFDAFNGANTDAEAIHAMQEIQTALALSQNDAQVRQIAEQISYSFPNGMTMQNDIFGFPWLTATLVRTAAPPATAIAQLIASDTPAAAAATSTPAALPATQPTSVPTSKPGMPLCGSALLIPIVFFGLAFIRRRRRAEWL